MSEHCGTHCPEKGRSAIQVFDLPGVKPRQVSNLRPWGTYHEENFIGSLIKKTPDHTPENQDHPGSEQASPAKSSGETRGALEVKPGDKQPAKPAPADEQVDSQEEEPVLPVHTRSADQRAEDFLNDWMRRFGKV